MKKPRGHPNHCSCATRNEECEAHFLEKVKALAKLNGWLVYHTRDSRGSDVGFPDLVLVGHGRLILAELKRERGDLSGPQYAWWNELRRAPCEVYTWRPSYWPDIENRLRRPDRGPRIPERPYDEQP